jgi:hypothetical protein
MVGTCTAGKVTVFNDGLHYARGFLHKLILYDRTERSCSIKAATFLANGF